MTREDLYEAVYNRMADLEAHMPEDVAAVSIDTTLRYVVECLRDVGQPTTADYIAELLED